MARFYVPEGSIEDTRVSISGKEAHHIMDVMRLKKFDKVVIFDGTGREYDGVIKDTARKSLSIEITGQRPAAHTGGLEITLIQSVPKKDKMDYIVEKATELGVADVIPVITARTIVDWDRAKRAAAAERWRKIAKEASKQCGRPDIPHIADIADFTDFLKDAAKYDLALMATLERGTVDIKDALKSSRPRKAAVAIGPEGDFTPVEVKDAQNIGFRLVSLGARVLKSDTAALAALAILNYEHANR